MKTHNIHTHFNLLRYFKKNDGKKNEHYALLLKKIIDFAKNLICGVKTIPVLLHTYYYYVK